MPAMSRRLRRILTAAAIAAAVTALASRASDPFVPCNPDCGCTDGSECDYAGEDPPTPSYDLDPAGAALMADDEAVHSEFEAIASFTEAGHLAHDTRSAMAHNHTHTAGPIFNVTVHGGLADEASILEAIRRINESQLRAWGGRA